MNYPYNPYYYPQMQNYNYAMQNQPQTPQPQTQSQNAGFITVQNEQEARRYPVGPSNSMTFLDESAPYVYTKTMGQSALDRPIFEKFRLVREEAAASEASDQTGKAPDLSEYALKSDLNAIYDKIENLKNQISQLKKKRMAREEEDDDE